MSIKDFICDYCGEECDGLYRLRIKILTTEKDQSAKYNEEAICCPECASTWLLETPDDFHKLKIIKEVLEA